MKRLIAACAASVTAAVLLAACGSSSSSSSSSSAAQAPSTTASSAAQSTPAPATPVAATGTEVSAKRGKLGTILAAGPKHLTVYLWEADKGPHSVCNGDCAKEWPPVKTTGTPRAGSGALSAELGMTKRADGSEQVTYKGHPLYFYNDDKDSGDAYGQGSKQFGASWYVMRPSGNKLDDDSGSGGDSS